MSNISAEQLGERVREARTRRGMSQAQLADQVRLDRTIINKIETGARRVSALELSDIANALRVQMVTFFQEPVPVVVSYRSSQGLDTVESAIEGHLSELASEFELLRDLSTVKLDGPDRKTWDAPTSPAEADELAAHARELVGLRAHEPVPDISPLFERIGFYVFTRELGADTADAGTLLFEDNSGVALLNSTNKVGRRRLAAAHELGHFLVADQYVIDWQLAVDSNRAEALFDRFARAFLMPADAIAAAWQKHEGVDGLRGAAVITASKFRIDMSTLARRLQEVGAIDAAAAGRIRTVRTTQSDMIEYDLYPHHEMEGTTQPRGYQRAVFQLVRDEKITTERAMQLLWNTIPESDLPLRDLRDESEIWQYVS